MTTRDDAHRDATSQKRWAQALSELKNRNKRLQSELATIQLQLQQSEQERTDLRSKYQAVGERVCVMFASKN